MRRVASQCHAKGRRTCHHHSPLHGLASSHHLVQVMGVCCARQPCGVANERPHRAPAARSPRPPSTPARRTHSEQQRRSQNDGERAEAGRSQQRAHATTEHDFLNQWCLPHRAITTHVSLASPHLPQAAARQRRRHAQTEDSAGAAGWLAVGSVTPRRESTRTTLAPEGRGTRTRSAAAAASQQPARRCRACQST